MYFEEFQTTCNQLPPGTKIQLKLSREKELTGEYLGYEIDRQTSRGRLIAKVDGKIVNLSNRIICAIKEIIAEMGIEEIMIRREFCSICKESFDINEKDHLSYSEDGSETEVFACEDCLGRLGKQRVLGDLAHHFTTRRTMKGVLRSIRGNI